MNITIDVEPGPHGRLVGSVRDPRTGVDIAFDGNLGLLAALEQLCGSAEIHDRKGKA